ncbi:hypothetical protein Taro_025014 [Colocasia esculenta]|uniref:Uncharacterized protein n=1 Tax=Colocasia esculenta TaxID=4460 RepID=A0A843V7S8_COLES|nr:hypothetical protein [Colocasia esculenta]
MLTPVRFTKRVLRRKELGLLRCHRSTLHFVHACGLPQDAPPDSLLPPATFNDDSAKEWIAYLNSLLTSLGPHREAFLIKRARYLDDVWSAVSSGARELGLYPQTVIPRPLESVLPSDTVSPSRCSTQPETRVGPDISLHVPSSKVANSPHDGADGATFSPHISMHVDPASTVHAGKYTVTGQDDLSHVPDPGETNNNGGGSFVPLSPASDLPVAIKKVEVAIKPSEHLSDVENSGVTSPLNASEPDSSEACVIFGDHGSDRSPRALEALEAQLAPLCSEAVDIIGQISMVRDQQASLLSTKRDKSARATLLHVLASHLDRSTAEHMQNSVALATRLPSLEA